MKVVYMSLTGNVREFVKRLDTDKSNLIEIADNLPIPIIDGEKYILIAPTYDPPVTDVCFDFIEDNGPENCVGLIGSGNKNFGDDGYIYTVKNISKEFGIEIIHDFEYAGFDKDVTAVNQILKGGE